MARVSSEPDLRARGRYSRAVLGTAVKLGVDFSVNARQDKKIRAIEAIAEDPRAPFAVLAVHAG